MDQELLVVMVETECQQKLQHLQLQEQEVEVVELTLLQVLDQEDRVVVEMLLQEPAHLMLEEMELIIQVAVVEVIVIYHQEHQDLVEQVVLVVQV
jgi:hypothetical protein